ncbi:SRPBCC family protein [Flavobacterium sp.]|uniref:SRPBCC family protein n=1 Tax=Flavobacterium sp. TaxID=239 RepID=UPI002636E166|nr:SRPBCC family protein [Flavobacterium sp.]MDD3003491.1 SRPBCC family protein [Flavobacterium sp.]
MHKLKKILIVLLVVFSLPLIIALFIKKDFIVEREIVIMKPKTEVFNYIKMIRNQDHFSKWNLTDPNMKKTSKGIDGTVGFVAMWDSENENLGKGEQEIVAVFEGEKIETKLRFIEPFEAEHDAYMITEAISESKTKVKWGFKGGFPYPMNLMGLFIDMDKEIGKDFEVGLENLKNILEK